MANDNWRTPPEVFAWASKQYDFNVDLACEPHNKLCEVGLTRDMNSLSLPWATVLQQTGGWGWLNPPYSDPFPWVAKAVEEQARGARIVMLLNADCSIRWFARALKGATRIVFFTANDEEQRSDDYVIGRIAFINGEGKPVKSNNKPQFMIEFGDPVDGAPKTDYVELAEVMQCNT